MHLVRSAARRQSPDPGLIQPAKFDNAHAIGNVGTAAYVIQTPAVLMMTTSLGNWSSRISCRDSRTGLDPAQVKTILVAHDTPITSMTAHFSEVRVAAVYAPAATGR